jgi:hypothetical protein
MKYTLVLVALASALLIAVVAFTSPKSRKDYNYALLLGQDESYLKTEFGDFLITDFMTNEIPQGNPREVETKIFNTPTMITRYPLFEAHFNARGVIITVKTNDGRLYRHSRQMINPDYLISKGFRRSTDSPHLFALDRITIGEIASNLDFAIKDMHPTDCQGANSDSRYVESDDLYFLIESIESDDRGQAICLDNPQTQCRVTVSLYRNAYPELRIKPHPKTMVKIQSQIKKLPDAPAGE